MLFLFFVWDEGGMDGWFHGGDVLDGYGNLEYGANEIKTDCRFQPHVANVVHMTVKPQDIVDEEENAKGGKAAGGRRGSVDRDAGCRCCVVM